MPVVVNRLSTRQAGQPLRYMGTKRAIAPTVRELVREIAPSGPVADLFSGMGSVASSLAPEFPVLTNNLLRFTTAFARARFLNHPRPATQRVVRRLLTPYQTCYRLQADRFGRRLSAEDRALKDRGSLLEYMRSAPHVGSSRHYLRRATAASGLSNAEDYALATLYFSGAYFSTRQAIELDGLRYAIDQMSEGPSRYWLLSAWLSAAAAVINAPGHTAQYLRPNGDDVYARIKRQWNRSIWEIFLDRLDDVRPVGTSAWRSSNRVANRDALALLESPSFDDVTVVYADPPYTKDQYSRYYHVYETLYLYDFPTSSGEGRYRGDRFTTPFSLKSEVANAFETLFTRVADAGLTLILSYPSDGLLVKHGGPIGSMIRKHFRHVEKKSLILQHSTMGASKGKHRKQAVENIYVATA